MLSALMMFRRLRATFRHAVREEAFLNIFGAGVTLVAIGTITFALSEEWNVVDSFYFSVSTLTTTSVADPDLVLTEGWTKLFTVFFQLIGIGVLVEILRRLGTSFVSVRAAEADLPK